MLNPEKLLVQAAPPPSRATGWWFMTIWAVWCERQLLHDGSVDGWFDIVLPVARVDDPLSL